MPLPPANSSRSSSSDFGTNTPLGARDWTSSPTARLSLIQFEPTPSATRLTAIRIGSSTCGELHSE